MAILIVTYKSGYTRTFEHIHGYCVDEYGVEYVPEDGLSHFIDPEKVKEVRLIKEGEES